MNSQLKYLHMLEALEFQIQNFYFSNIGQKLTGSHKIQWSLKTVHKMSLCWKIEVFFVPIKTGKDTGF